MLLFFRQSLLICYVILGSLKTGTPPAPEILNRHPLHLSASTFNCNAKTGTIEISCRIFTDDLENLIGSKYQVKPDLSASSRHKEMDVLLNKYMSGSLQLAVNGKPVRLSYLGFENDNEAVILYMETAKVGLVKQLVTTCTVMYDQFDDQTNIFHITRNGDRRSFKLSFPEKKFSSTL